MEEVLEVEVEGLSVRIDRSKCAAFKDCLGIAPDIFELGDDGIVKLVGKVGIQRDDFLEACSVCPVDVFVVRDEQGNQLIPR
jgi:ferredoxin